MQSNSILPFWQEIGTSTSIIAQKVSEKLQQKTSHTGTLDPMASGVVLILAGDNYSQKEKFIQEEKTYEFNILFGFSTDTHDALGLITSINTDFKIDFENAQKKILLMKGKYRQQYPDFSSKKFQGKHLWEYHRLGIEIPKFYLDGEIYDIRLGNVQTISRESLFRAFNNQISQIKGNFRQEEILKQYSNQNLLLPKLFYYLPTTLVMSRGLYVRGFVRDISNILNLPAIVANLIRTKDGDFQKKDCFLLDEFFNLELKSDPNFLKPKMVTLK